MFFFKLDTQGDLAVRQPVRDKDVIALGRAYLSHETSLPADQRLALPSLDQVQALQAQAETAMSSANVGEADWAESAGDLKTMMEGTIPLLERAIQRLKGTNADNLGRLEQWGLETYTNKRGWISVRKPKSDRGWGEFLVAYVNRETQQPEEQRITDPSFDQMSALAAEWQGTVGSRDSARTQREKGVDSRRRAVEPLRGVLRLAATALVVTRYNGVVTKDLLDWGFEVVARKTAGEEEDSSADGSAEEGSGAGQEAGAAPAGGTGSGASAASTNSTGTAESGSSQATASASGASTGTGAQPASGSASQPATGSGAEPSAAAA